MSGALHQNTSCTPDERKQNSKSKSSLNHHHAKDSFSGKYAFRDMWVFPTRNGTKSSYRRRDPVPMSKQSTEN